MLPGQTKWLRIRVHRKGNDSQPITLKWMQLPPGISGDAKMDLAAGQDSLITSLQCSSDVPMGSPFSLRLQGQSKYHGAELSIESDSKEFWVERAPVRAEFHPQRIQLAGPREWSQVVVTGYDEKEVPRDWTRDGSIVSSNESVVKVERGQVRPVGNGSAELSIDLGPLKYKIPVEVTDFDAPKPVAFENEVLVALSKQGCNSGACHGSPSGKGSFRLSLRAFDPKLDQLTLIREDFGRRVDILNAEQSLLLLKPLMKTTHGGGMQLHKTDPAYGILRDWIAGGAKADPPNTARCVKLEVVPGSKRVLDLKRGDQQLAVVAVFADGTRRDVTRLVAYESSNQNVAVVSTDGLVTPRQRGEAAILVRFLEHIESIQLMFTEDVPGFVWKDPPVNNYVDHHVYAKLKQLQYLPSETCSDSDFLRRVYLDVIGTLPTIEETEKFLADTSPTKRENLIDQLVERPEHAKFWALKWCDLLRVTAKTVGDEGVHKYHRWVEEAIRSNMPYDEFAKQLLTASGSTLANPPANFYRTASDMNECVENVSQVFLGARLQCAKCHNHPFERWTQDNYYGLGAFFQRVQRKKTLRPGEQFIWTATAGEVTQPRTGEMMQPWLPKKARSKLRLVIDERFLLTGWFSQTIPTSQGLKSIEFGVTCFHEESLIPSMIFATRIPLRMKACSMRWRKTSLRTDLIARRF